MKSCFVISPIGNEGSEVREHADDVFEYIVKPAAEKAGYRSVRADHSAKPGLITEYMYDRILADDILIAVLTFHNPNVFYEIAVAECAARPLILLILRDQPIPFDIKDRNVLFYDLKPRTLFEGKYVDQLVQAIKSLDGLAQAVPFRPSLSPLGSGNATMRFVERYEEVALGDRIDIIRSANSFVWYGGLSLFGFAKTQGLVEEVQPALERGVNFRVLIMDPESPTLGHQLRDFSSNYVETVRQEIRAGLEFWRTLAADRALEVRLQKQGVMSAMLQMNDGRMMQTAYTIVRPTADSPTILATSNDPAYRSAKSDFEWLWGRAAAI